MRTKGVLILMMSSCKFKFCQAKGVFYKFSLVVACYEKKLGQQHHLLCILGPFQNVPASQLPGSPESGCLVLSPTQAWNPFGSFEEDFLLFRPRFGGSMFVRRSVWHKGNQV